MDARSTVLQALREWAKGCTSRELTKTLNAIREGIAHRTLPREDQVDEYNAALAEAIRRLSATTPEQHLLDTGKFPEADDAAP